MTEQPYADLLSRCVLRDRKAFETLYRLSSPRLFSALLRIFNRRDLAEDVLQEVYIKIWDNAHLYHEQKGTAITWMLTLARNKAIDWLRKMPSRETIDIELITETSAEEQQTSHDEIFELLDKCFQQLHDEYRSAISLSYIHGLSHSELAKKLDKPIGTVKSWVRRGVGQLQRCLQV